MKKFYKIFSLSLFFFLIVHCTLTINNCMCQWQTDVRITNNPALSYTSLNTSHSIATNGDILHVAWYDNRDGNNEIYYNRSTNGGINWGADIRLTNDPNISQYHSIAVSGQYVHIVWEEYRDGNREIYYKRSADEGISWGVDTRLTNNSSVSAHPCIAVSSSYVHIVWRDDRMGNMEVFYKRSTDNGTTWSSDTSLSDFPGWSWLPSVAVSGQFVHVVFNDTRDGNGEIYYKHSTDGGISWDIDTRLTNNAASSYYPSVALSGSLVHVVWNDDRDGNYEIYYKSSTDGGINWGAETRLTNYSGISNYPSIAVSGSNLHVSWNDNRSGNNEIYYKLSTDGGVNWGIDGQLTNDTANSVSPSISVSNSILNIVWSDYRDGNYEIYYKRNPTGNLTGIENINTEIPKEYKLMQNYPNPFNPVTKIRFTFPNSSFAKLVIYDALGRELETLVKEQLNAGTYEADWNASNYPSGVYFYKLEAGDFSETKKMLMVK